MKMEVFSKRHRHFRNATLMDMRRMSSGELIIISESDSIIQAWSALTILEERGFPVEGPAEEWAGACAPHLNEEVNACLNAIFPLRKSLEEKK
jgi:hypothetical protein